MSEFKYREGETIALSTNAYAELGTENGAVGVIWARYAIAPPHYEVTFCDSRTGEEFDLTVSEDEICAAVEAPARLGSAPLVSTAA